MDRDQQRLPDALTTHHGSRGGVPATVDLSGPGGTTDRPNTVGEMPSHGHKTHPRPGGGRGAAADSLWANSRSMSAFGAQNDSPGHEQAQEGGAGGGSSAQQGHDLQAELKAVRDMLPAPAVLACNEAFVQVIIMRTAYSRIQARLAFQEGYPQVPLLVELASPSLPQPLLKKLRGRCEEEAAKRVGSAQVTAVVTLLQDEVNTNKLLPCWKEFRQTVQQAGEKGTEVRADNSKGLILLKVKSGAFWLRMSIQVPDSYPEEGCRLSIKSHNFPGWITQAHLLQAEEIVRRCVNGYSAEMALQSSNPIRMPAKASKPSGEYKLTNEHMRNLKHDVNFLKKASNLREFDDARTKGNHTMMAHSTQERRAARRELKTLSKSEMASEEEQIKRMADLELREQEEAIQARPSDTAQPSLFPVVHFMIDIFAARLPQEDCVSCGRRVLPTDDPKAAPVTDPQHPDRPTRVFCGHWFHYSCLGTWMTEPPFGKDCSKCGRRVYHPDWPQTVKQLERAWAMREARTREIGEVSEFLGVGGDFQKRSSSGDDFSAFS